MYIKGASPLNLKDLLPFAMDRRVQMMMFVKWEETLVYGF